MTYKETTEYLFNSTPLFQNVGKTAYKEGLANTYLLDERNSHPHRHYMTIHVGGTNGKGSVSHTIAAVLQAAGYRVGLFTSPHLVDFRERIRINGEMIPEERVIRFVEENRTFLDEIHPSFFEVTTAMAFQYFAEQGVDIAVIEVGLGGRLDCTNIITPLLSIITNISFDHVQFLGNTLAGIASEKAGIMKQDVPCVVGEWVDETRPVFELTAAQIHAPLTFAEDEKEVTDFAFNPNGGIDYVTRSFGRIHGELGGMCQTHNANTILKALSILKQQGTFVFDEKAVAYGFRNVCETTGLMGRWQKLSDSPLTYCDTGHNSGGFQYIVKQLQSYIDRGINLHIVFGMVNDKDITTVLSMLPASATYYFTQASVKRALPAEELQALAAKFDLRGDCYSSVSEAYEKAKAASGADSLIYVGGSTFVVADMFSKA